MVHAEFLEYVANVLLLSWLYYQEKKYRIMQITGLKAMLERRILDSGAMTSPKRLNPNVQSDS